MSAMKKGMDALGSSCLSDMISERIKDYGEIKQVIREWKVRYQEKEHNCEKGMKYKCKTIL
jgi:hypothetical protein